MRNLLRISSPALVTLVIAVWFSGALFPPSYDGLPVTPISTLVLIPIAKAALFIVAAVALGLAAIPGFLTGDLPLARRAAPYAFTVAALALLNLLLTLSDILAVQPWAAVDLEFLFSFITQIDEGRYLMLQVLLAIVAGWTFLQLRTELELVFGVLALSVAGVLPAFTGHSTAAITHWIVSTIMVFHLAALLVWLGGIVGLISVGPTQAAVRRFSALAFTAYVAIALSGIASTFSRVASWSDFFQDRYAIVLLAKVVLVIVLGVIGFRLRNAIAANAESMVLTKLLSTEVALLGMTVALAVTLARMANP